MDVDHVEDELDEELLSPDIDQQMTRGRDEEGRVYVQGVARVRVPAGHRAASLHIAICPPFDELPQVQVEQIAGPPAIVRVGMSLLQGIRFDVRTSQVTNADEAIIVEFYVC